MTSSPPRLLLLARSTGNNGDVDLLIQRASAVPAVGRERHDTFVRSTRPLPRNLRRRGRRSAVVIGAVTGVPLLAAGASTAVLALHRSPYQGLPDGISRTSMAIPVAFVSTRGAENRCQVYLELRAAALRALPITPATASPDDRRPTWNGIAMHCPGGQR